MYVVLYLSLMTYLLFCLTLFLMQLQFIRKTNKEWWWWWIFFDNFVSCFIYLLIDATAFVGIEGDIETDGTKDSTTNASPIETLPESSENKDQCCNETL